MTDDHQDARPVNGRVKWFDPGKGFGFIVPDEGGGDVLLHANVLRNFGQSSVADGSEISILAIETRRGMQATEVLDIVPPADAPPQPLSDLADLAPEDIAATPLEPARVKWFDKTKGFGFANVFGSPDDIFIHVEVLRQSALSDLLPGEAISIRVIEGRRGRMATAVESWDAGVNEADE